MARTKNDSEDVEFVIEDEEEEDEKVSSGEAQRYEVKIGPPVISGRKVKPTYTPGSESEKGRPAKISQETSESPKMRGGGGYSSSVSPQHLYKMEDELRRTRDIVEDLRHTVSVLEGEIKDLKGDMDRATYLLRSFEGLKNTMKDVESTVSELSGLYDLISSEINPFVEIPPLKKRRVKEQLEKQEESETDSEFRELSDIFEEEEEGEDVTTWDRMYLESEEWVLRWTKFLIDRVGKEGLEKVLNYYIDLEWIDQDLKDRVLELAKGTPTRLKKGDVRKKKSWKMDAEDHVKSLEYIRKVKG